MKYEVFKEEVEEILTELGEPIPWNEIREKSEKLNQKVPFHGHVRKLQGDIGLIRVKDDESGREVWALQRWFQDIGDKEEKIHFKKHPTGAIIVKYKYRGEKEKLIPANVDPIKYAENAGFWREGQRKFWKDKVVPAIEKEFGNKNRKQTFLIPPQKVKITLLCKAKGQYSRSLGKITHCMAGAPYEPIEGKGKLIRLYPFEKKTIDKVGIEKWSIIECPVRNFFPESNRPESIKTWPRKVSLIGEMDETKAREKILSNLKESGEFLHTDAWKGKTLGLIKPKMVNFYIKGEDEENVTRCSFQCSYYKCTGHDMTVWDSEIRRAEDFQELEKKDLYFLLGTHSQHPHRWLLISILDSSGLEDN